MLSRPLRRRIKALTRFLLGCLAINCSVMANTLTVSLFPIHKDVDHTHIVSAGEYIVLDHFFRNMIWIDKHASIQADLAESWNVDHSKKSIHFKLKKDQKFSNGEVIKASHVISSWKYQQSKGTATHYDFSLIKSFKQMNDFEFEITMASEINIDLFTSLSQPEFGVIYNPEKASDYSISSGPFYLESKTENEFHLVKNPYFISSGKTDKLIIQRQGVQQDSFEKLESGKLDFYIPYTGLSNDDAKKLSVSKIASETRPNIGFTYWLSLNPDLMDERERVALRDNVALCMNKENLNFGGWERARQLVFPNSFGAMSEVEMKGLYTTEGKADFGKKTIKFLSFKGFAFNEQIQACIKSLGGKVEYTTYSDQKELSKLIKENSYHVVLNNNDFASLNVLKNFKWAFNESRPLFFLGKYKEKCLNLIEEGYRESDKLKREKIVISLQKTVLENALAVPLAYKRVIYLHNKKIKLDQWPMNFPFINFDKI
ncbi:MAG: hypothetical protein EP326_01905 [Deltaproteobacteria bacterium]|nr:MAG: hypothetical protein EP326_01905 [Deltaproteobacteria bacterium]